MTDQPSPIESEDQIERRIDEVISQAAELAKDLKDELGDPEPAGLDRDQKFFESQAASEAAPEMQLAQADAAIAHAAREIGSQPPPPKATKITLPPRNAKPVAADSAGNSPRQTNQDAKAAFPEAASTAAPVPAQSDSAESVAVTTDSAGKNDPSAPVSRATPTPSHLPASSPIERLLRLIEAIDRPFGAVSQNVRWVLGWVALVFLVGAASLFFFVIL